MADGNEATPETSKATPSGTLTQEDVFEYGDVHKLVLQGLMSAGFLDNKGVKRLFVGACSYLNMDPEQLTKMSFVQKVVRGINDKIKQYDMAIKSASCELTGKKYYVFLLTVEKPIMKLQTLYPKFQTDLFQRVMDTILRKYNDFSVPVTECINLSLEVDTKANLEVAERFLLKMMDQNYLTKLVFGTREDEYTVTLGFRGLREFEPMLRELYCDVVSTCCFCKVILLHGYVCPDCKCHVHRPCYARLLPSTRECPMCAASWEDPLLMQPRVRNESGQEHDDQRPTTSREAVAGLRKQQQVKIVTKNVERATINEAETQEMEIETKGLDVHDVEGETDGVVTRDSDNEDAGEHITRSQLESSAEIDPPSTKMVTRRRNRRVYNSSDTE